MGNRRISRDLKLAAVKMYETKLLSLYDILDCVGFSRATFFRILKLWHETGDVIKTGHCFRGRRRRLNLDDLHYLLRLIRARPDWFLDELLGLLDENRFISVHFTTIFRKLRRAGVSLKKLKRIAKERDEDVRADFVREMAEYSTDQLGFLDEVSKDERTKQRRKGRSRKGRRAQMKGVFVRGKRLSAEGVLTVDGMIASTVVYGSMTRELFLEFLKHEVVSKRFLFYILGF